MIWAVHISNNVLTPMWIWGGVAVAAVLVFLAAWRLQQDEIPRIAMLTAVFYVASSIHVPTPPSSTHLLLNGLVGVVLGWRAPLAIFVGLLFQAVLIGHGGYFELGINTCVMAPPALLAWVVFRGLHRVRWFKHPAARAFLVFGSTAVWFLGGLATLALVSFSFREDVLGISASEDVLWVLLHPLSLGAAAALGGIAAWIERRLETAPEFPLGLTIGVTTVMLTVALNCAVLIAGGADFGPTPPLVLAMIHIPIAAVEGVVLGFTVGFLAKVKPELLGIGPVSHPGT